MRLRGILTVVLIAACLMLAAIGCEKRDETVKTPLAKHTGNYSTAANISYKELKATATISQETPSACSVVFESPASLKDMAFVFRQDSVDLNYKGLSYQFEPGSMPGGAVAKIAVSAINRAMKNDGMSITLDDGALELRGMMECGEFCLRVDGDTGNLMKLSIPSEELEIEFSNFKFLD